MSLLPWEFNACYEFHYHLQRDRPHHYDHLHGCLVERCPGCLDLAELDEYEVELLLRFGEEALLRRTGRGEDCCFRSDAARDLVDYQVSVVADWSFFLGLTGQLIELLVKYRRQGHHKSSSNHCYAHQRIKGIETDPVAKMTPARTAPPRKTPPAATPTLCP